MARVYDAGAQRGPRMRLLPVLLLMCASVAVAQATNSCGSWEVPVSVMLPDGRVIRGLKAADFIAKAGKSQVSIADAVADNGNRRILLVASATGMEGSSDARKVALAVIPGLLDQAQPEDSFAFLGLAKPSKKVPFGRDRQALVDAVKEWSSAGKSSDPDQVLADLHDALDLFSASRRGDSIIVVGPDVGFGDSSYARFMEEVGRRGIRVFHLLVGSIMAGSYYTFMEFGARGPTINSSTMPTRASLYRMAWDSGGFAWYAGGNPIQRIRLTDEKQEELRRQLWRVYVNVVDFYSVRLLLPPTRGRSQHLTVDLAETVRKKAPAASVLYPRTLPNCQAETSPAEAK